MKRAKIANLASGIGVVKVSNGHKKFWRVRLGRRFTGGEVQTKHFTNLDDARKWIFGDALKHKAALAPMVELKQSFGAAAFALTPAQISEAHACFRKLDGLASLTEAVSYFLKHANPAGGKRTVEEVAKEFSSLGGLWESASAL